MWKGSFTDAGEEALSNAFRFVQAAFWIFPLRMQRVQTVFLFTRPFSMTRIFCRFGLHVRFVLLFAWLT